jgi:glycosyltransferase involved in cell wall biosynthesis
VSIVVPVWNGAATIGACLDSLLAIDYPSPRLELIVVDNASTDDTARILERYAREVRIVREETRGSAAARNAGIREATGDLIALTDADCVVDRNWLQHLVDPLNDPRVGIVGGRILASPPGNPIERFGERIHDHRRAIEEYNPPYAITMNWASHRNLFPSVGFFNETLLRGSDAEMAFRIGARGYRLVYRHEAVVYHRNEATLHGLFAEGIAHGRGIEMMRVARGEKGFFQALNLRFRLRELNRSLGEIVTGPERGEALFQFVFDVGKLTGRHLEHLAPSRSQPVR